LAENSKRPLNGGERFGGLSGLPARFGRVLAALASSSLHEGEEKPVMPEG
jgi:hypothetical protein